MANKYFPTLIIGAGGTGIKVARFIQSLADSGLDTDLKEMLDRGAIQLVGIDTDKKSNEGIIKLDSNIGRTQDGDSRDMEQVPKKLSRLPKNWIHLDRSALNHAVTRVHEATGVEQGESGDALQYPLASIRDWFPLRNEKTKDQITLGHSKLAGAAQWRPLGRMSLFLSASRVFEALQKAFKEVQQADPEQGPVRAYIVCSLAGGTGSGMFWDLAFFLQMIDPGTRTSGMFLLGDPFESVDEGGRIFPNIYAALKELAGFKNWQKSLTVNYPIGRGRTFKGQRQGPLAFDMVYLYQSFMPGPEVDDRAIATIDVSCFRLAQNMLALCRKDLHAILDVGANNMDSDTTAMASSPESTYGFSTTGTTIFAMHQTSDIEREIRQQLINTLRPQKFRPTDQIDHGELLKLLEFTPGKNPFSQLREQLLEDMTTFSPGQIGEHKLRLDGTLESLNKDAEYALESLKELLGTPLVETLNEAFDTNHPIMLGDFKDELSSRINKKLAQFSQNLTEHLEKVEELLDSNCRDALERWIEELDQSLPEGTADTSIRLEKPTKGYGNLRDLTGETPQRQGQIKKLAIQVFGRIRGQDVPKESRLKSAQQVFTKIKNDLEQFKLDPATSIEPILNHLFNERRKDWREQLEEFLKNRAERAKYEEQRLEQDSHIRGVFAQEKIADTPPDPSHLSEFLKICVPPDDPKLREDWLEDHLGNLVPKIDEGFNALLPRRQYTTRKPLNFREPLTKLVEAYGAQSHQDTKPLNLKPMLQFVLDLIDIEDPERNLQTSKDAKVLIDRVYSICQAVVSYWKSCGSLVMQQAGGEEGLRERLLRCRSKLFSSGIIENKLNKKHLIVMPYSEDAADYSKDEQRSIKETFDIMAQEVMHTKSLVSNQPTDTPIIFYNDMFRSAEEISRIRDYYNAYVSFGREGNTTFYHIHRDLAALLPDVVGQAVELLPVYCGNPDCSKNLRNISRNKINCPGCDRPIWNRCGNANCPEDNLRETFLEKAQDGYKPIKTKIPFDCPTCQQGLKTYWWRCSDPLHNDKIPTDKETCPECHHEYLEGRRVQKKVIQRPDLRHLICAGCMSIKEDDEFRIKVPWPLVHYYEEGVNGHDTLQFRELVQHYRNNTTYKVGAHLCPNGRNEHYLFPTCPKDPDNPTTRHHLYHRKGRFGCTKHPELKFFLCYNCHYPVEEGLQPHAGCPRCLRPVRKCYYCSDKYNMVYEPLKGSYPERCPQCTNPMDLRVETHDEFLQANLLEPAFCANIYGCRAGSDPWHTSSEYRGTKTLKAQQEEVAYCRVCPDPPGPLLPRNDLRELVKACPLCMVVLSPIIENNQEHWYSGQSLIKSYLDRETTKGDLAKVLDANCWLCGSQPKRVLRWMERDEYLKSKEHPRGPNSSEAIDVSASETFQKIVHEVSLGLVPQINFWDALELLITLRHHQDNLEAFATLKKVMSIQELLDWNIRDHETMLNLFPQGSSFVQVLRQRLNGLWEKQGELKSRSNRWLSGSEPTFNR